MFETRSCEFGTWSTALIVAREDCKSRVKSCKSDNNQIMLGGSQKTELPRKGFRTKGLLVVYKSTKGEKGLDGGNRPRSQMR